MKGLATTKCEQPPIRCPSLARSRPLQPLGQPWLAFLLVLLLSACGVSPQAEFSRPQEQPVFLPPTRAPLPALEWSPTSAATQITPALSLQGDVTPTPLCENNLRYIEDLSLPDGSLVPPGEGLDKRWRVENSGTCNWDERYRIKLIAGPALGAPSEQALYPARAGTQAELRILFVAPREAGTYRSAWQAFSPEGQPFGDPVFIEVVVGNP